MKIIVARCEVAQPDIIESVQVFKRNMDRFFIFGTGGSGKEYIA